MTRRRRDDELLVEREHEPDEDAIRRACEILLRSASEADRGEAA